MVSTSIWDLCIEKSLMQDTQGFSLYGRVIKAQSVIKNYHNILIVFQKEKPSVE